MTKKPGRKPTKGDTEPTATQNEGKKPAKRRSPAAKVAPPTDTPAPDRSGAISDPPAIPTVQQAEINTRFENAALFAKQKGILCTGSPTFPVCEAPAALGISLNNRLFAVPCREHQPEVLRALLAQGHDNVKTFALVYAMQLRGEEFQRSAAFLRERNQQTGVTIPPREKP